MLETQCRRLSSTQDPDHPGNCGLHIWWCWCLASRLIRGWAPLMLRGKSLPTPPHTWRLSLSVFSPPPTKPKQISLQIWSFHCMSLWKAVWAKWCCFESRFNQVSTQGVLHSAADGGNFCFGQRLFWPFTILTLGCLAILHCLQCTDVEAFLCYSIKLYCGVLHYSRSLCFARSPYKEPRCVCAVHMVTP